MKYDAIVILANLMDQEGNLNGETSARVAKAVSLFKEGVASTILCCGWAYRHDSTMCIGDAMARHVVDRLGLASSDVLIERNSRDTVGDAIFSKMNFYNPRSWSDVLVVTSDYHVDRTRFIFSFVYGKLITVVPSIAYVSDDVREHEAASIKAFQETFLGIAPGDDKAIVRRLLAKHPFYNGHVYPCIDAANLCLSS